MTHSSDLLTKREALSPELHGYLRDGPMGKMLHHPLLISICVDVERAAWINTRFRLVKAAVMEAFAQRNWPRYIFLHERPYRLDALLEIKKFLSLPKFWKLMASVWMDTENFHEQIDYWMDLWETDIPSRPLVMSRQERKLLKLFPDEVFIHRGQSANHSIGMSWTLSKDKAKWFALRNRNENPVLLTTVVYKDEILAYFTGRGEEEIVVQPEHCEMPNEEAL